jgi:hypothetical protein
MEGVAEESFVGFRCVTEFFREDRREISRSRRLGSGFLGVHDPVGARVGIDSQHKLVGVRRKMAVRGSGAAAA